MFYTSNSTPGIGVDIENISRFQGLDTEKDARFLNKIFTKKELHYCFSTANPAEHLAVRFAGKEAVIKALNTLNKTAPVYKEIEILNDERGVPRAHVTGIAGIDILLSLSHSRETAIAFTVVTLKKEKH